MQSLNEPRTSIRLIWPVHPARNWIASVAAEPVTRTRFRFTLEVHTYGWFTPGYVPACALLEPAAIRNAAGSARMNGIASQRFISEEAR